MARTRGRRRLLRGLVGLLVLVGVVMVVLWALQRQLIYVPDPSSVPPAGEVIDGAEDVTLQTEDGLELGAWFVPVPGRTGKSVAVLLAPGNGGNRAGRAELAGELNRRGFAVLVMDYRGYGGNPGEPSEEGLAKDAVAASDALQGLGFPPSRTIYFGESLGTGVVSALAARRPPAGMVLRSPFTELADVGSHHYPFLPVRLLLRDRFPVLSLVSAGSVPVTVVYGDRDSVVPSSLSAQVADGAAELVERVVIEGADHNDTVMFGPRVADAVARLARHVDARRAPG